eukprot:s525_g2.t1
MSRRIEQNLAQEDPESKAKAKDAGPSSELQSPLAAVLSFECSSRFPSGVSSGDGQHIDSERGPDPQIEVIMAFKVLSKVIALTGLTPYARAAPADAPGTASSSATLTSGLFSGTSGSGSSGGSTAAFGATTTGLFSSINGSGSSGGSSSASAGLFASPGGSGITSGEGVDKKTREPQEPSKAGGSTTPSFRGVPSEAGKSASSEDGSKVLEQLLPLFESFEKEMKAMEGNEVAMPRIPDQWASTKKTCKAVAEANEELEKSQSRT